MRSQSNRWTSKPLGLLRWHWRQSPGSRVLPFCSQKTATIAGECPGPAHVSMVSWPGAQSLLHSTAMPSFSWKVPWSVKTQEKEVNSSEKGEGFADLGQWMGPLWREAGWHFSNSIFQLRCDPNFPQEHTDFQKMALQKKYRTTTFLWDQNIWMGKAYFVRMGMDGKGDFARKPLSQLGLGWIQIHRR